MQQEFDIIVKHLYTQGRPAKQGENGICLYREKHDDGTVLKCAIGCRIPDSRYSPNMEERPYNELMRLFGHRLSKTLGKYKMLYEELQYTHDNCMTKKDGTFIKSNLTKRLKEIAHKLDLSFIVPKIEKANNAN